jgi:hypothetical protein
MAIPSIHRRNNVAAGIVWQLLSVANRINIARKIL